MGSLSQMSQFVFEYLDAPVSVKEIIADCGKCGPHHPGENFRTMGCGKDETQFRYFMGPYIKAFVEVYNSFFDATGCDLIVIPSALAATPDLAPLTNSKVALTPIGGKLGDVTGDDGGVFGQNILMKELHIPKMAVPTGLTSDGRPTAIQFWGRAAPYEKMFDDDFSAQRDIEFLHLVDRVSAAVQSRPELRRVDCDMVRPLREA